MKLALKKLFMSFQMEFLGPNDIFGPKTKEKCEYSNCEVLQLLVMKIIILGFVCDILVTCVTECTLGP